MASSHHVTVSLLSDDGEEETDKTKKKELTGTAKKSIGTANLEKWWRNYQENYIFVAKFASKFVFSISISLIKSLIDWFNNSIFELQLFAW